MHDSCAPLSQRKPEKTLSITCRLRVVGIGPGCAGFDVDVHVCSLLLGLTGRRLRGVRCVAEDDSMQFADALKDIGRDVVGVRGCCGGHAPHRSMCTSWWTAMLCVLVPW